MPKGKAYAESCVDSLPILKFKIGWKFVEARGPRTFCLLSCGNGGERKVERTNNFFSSERLLSSRFRLRRLQSLPSDRWYIGEHTLAHRRTRWCGEREKGLCSCLCFCVWRVLSLFLSAPHLRGVNWRRGSRRRWKKDLGRITYPRPCTRAKGRK